MPALADRIFIYEKDDMYHNNIIQHFLRTLTIEIR